MNPRMIVRTRLMPKLFILVLDDTKKWFTNFFFYLANIPVVFFT